METNRELFFRKVREAESICIGSHMNPDGDNLGSLSALYHYLLKMGKNVSWYGIDSVPDNLKFLPGLKNRTKDVEPAALFIALDCGDGDRLGPGKKIMEESDYVINIDHHLSNTEFGDLNIVETVSSTGELLYKILAGGPEDLDVTIATGLFSAISTDTGSFKYDSAGSETFHIAGELMKYGVPLNEVSVQLYQTRSIPKTNLLIAAMENAEYYEDGQIAVTSVSLKMVEDCNAKPSDTEGIVEFLRDTDPVEISILLKERRNNTVKVSVRGKNYVNVIPIVTPLGGGGHFRAAGATGHGTLEEVKAQVLKSAVKELEHARNSDCR